MKIENPFTNGQIKNYLLLYASIVVIMVLFFIATTLFNDIKDVDKKVFNTQMDESTKVLVEEVENPY
ncbi:MAG: hypothetical protein Q9M40_05110 [Sulfurimonas sp.]|nr:hypothetical protein [Sulfurimonas sp.]